MNPITVFQLASWTIGLWDYWLVGIEAGAGPITVYSCREENNLRHIYISNEPGQDKGSQPATNIKITV